MDFVKGFENVMQHVCGFCSKVFKVESKLDRHIVRHHSYSGNDINGLDEGNDAEKSSKQLLGDFKNEVKDETCPAMTKVKVRKMPSKYNNLYGFDPINTVWLCVSCGANFMSDRGVRNHLNVTKCGFGEKDDYKPKNEYKSLYLKDGGQLICSGCGAVYQSEHGIYHHLKSTKCGFGDKDGPNPKKDFTPFYKIENSIFICLVCCVNYDTIRGMHYHLNKKCGAEAKLKVSQPRVSRSEVLNKSPDGEKKNYKQFYKKEDNSTLTCLGCETVYYSSHGMHNHLNTTKCGFGDKFRSPPKTCYLQLYKRQGEQWFCLGCRNIYGSGRGIHHHLKSTKCGFGEKENVIQKRNFTAMYCREEGIYSCNTCQFKVQYINGIHRHLQKCVAGYFDEPNASSAVRNVDLDLAGVKQETIEDNLMLHETDNQVPMEEKNTHDYMDVPLE